MTKDEIAALKGAELDRAVLEQVMGWKLGGDPRLPCAWKKPDGWCISPADPETAPSSDKAAAWNVAEKLREDGYAVAIIMTPNGNMCEIKTPPDIVVNVIAPSSAQEALCLAALYAKAIQQCETKAEPDASAMSEDKGCQCQRCGRYFKVDFHVPDDLWERIKPEGKPEHAGLLRGPCITESLERLDNFDAYTLLPISEAQKLLPTTSEGQDQSNMLFAHFVCLRCDTQFAVNLEKVQRSGGSFCPRCDTWMPLKDSQGKVRLVWAEEAPHG